MLVEALHEVVNVLSALFNTAGRPALEAAQALRPPARTCPATSPGMLAGFNRDRPGARRAGLRQGRALARPAVDRGRRHDRRGPAGAVRASPVACLRRLRSGEGGLPVLDGGGQAGPDVLGVGVDVPAVRDREARHQVQAQPALGGIAVDGGRRASTPGPVADVEQPAAAAGDDGRHDGRLAVPQRVGGQLVEGQDQPLAGGVRPVLAGSPPPRRLRRPARAAGSSATVPRSQRHTSPRPSGSGRSGHASRPMPSPRVQPEPCRPQGCPAGPRGSIVTRAASSSVRVGRRRGPDRDERDVVLGRALHHPLQERRRTARSSGRPARSAQLAREPVHAVVEGAAPALDQPVGVEQDGGARCEVDDATPRARPCGPPRASGRRSGPPSTVDVAVRGRRASAADGPALAQRSRLEPSGRRSGARAGRRRRWPGCRCACRRSPRPGRAAPRPARRRCGGRCPRSSPRSWPIAAAAAVSWPTTSPMTTTGSPSRCWKASYQSPPDPGGLRGRDVADHDLRRPSMAGGSVSRLRCSASASWACWLCRCTRATARPGLGGDLPRGVEVLVAEGASGVLVEGQDADGAALGGQREHDGRPGPRAASRSRAGPGRHAGPGRRRPTR